MDDGFALLDGMRFQHGDELLHGDIGIGTVFGNGRFRNRLLDLLR